MTPRKKQYSTRSEQQRAYEQRLQEAGKRRVCLWLGDDTIDKLARLAEAKETDRGAVIEALVTKAREPKKPK
jgi:hypothetical protein